MKQFLAEKCESLSITVDAWLSRIEKVYLSIIAHWIDDNRTLHFTVLDLIRFAIPHTSESAATVILIVLESWGVRKKLRIITTDNAADLFLGVRLLCDKLHTVGYDIRSIPDFHVCVSRTSST